MEPYFVFYLGKILLIVFKKMTVKITMTLMMRGEAKGVLYFWFRETWNTRIILFLLFLKSLCVVQVLLKSSQVPASSFHGLLALHCRVPTRTLVQFKGFSFFVLPSKGLHEFSRENTGSQTVRQWLCRIGTVIYRVASIHHLLTRIHGGASGGRHVIIIRMTLQSEVVLFNGHGGFKVCVRKDIIV